MFLLSGWRILKPCALTWWKRGRSIGSFEALELPLPVCVVVEVLVADVTVISSIHLKFTSLLHQICCSSAIDIAIEYQAIMIRDPTTESKIELHGHDPLPLSLEGVVRTLKDEGVRSEGETVNVSYAVSYGFSLMAVLRQLWTVERLVRLQIAGVEQYLDDIIDELQNPSELEGQQWLCPMLISLPDALPSDLPRLLRMVQSRNGVPNPQSRIKTINIPAGFKIAEGIAKAIEGVGVLDVAEGSSYWPVSWALSASRIRVTWDMIQGLAA